MSYNKALIYNMTLSHLLLAREVVEVETDKSNEVRVLNIWWQTALDSTLQDLDLDSLSTQKPLELITELDEGPWTYVYKYPSNCAFFRKIRSCAQVDNSSTHIPKATGVYNGQKVIYTNEYQAVGLIIPKDVPLSAFSPMAATALSLRLASLASPLLVGKGAKTLRKELDDNYLIAKAEAQEADTAENMNYDPEYVRSEFVNVRLS